MSRSCVNPLFIAGGGALLYGAYTSSKSNKSSFQNNQNKFVPTKMYSKTSSGLPFLKSLPRAEKERLNRRLERQNAFYRPGSDDQDRIDENEQTAVNQDKPDFLRQKAYSPSGSNRNSEYSRNSRKRSEYVRTKMYDESQISNNWKILGGGLSVAGFVVCLIGLVLYFIKDDDNYIYVITPGLFILGSGLFILAIYRASTNNSESAKIHNINEIDRRNKEQSSLTDNEGKWIGN